jgi:HD-GYP domain-containing protein (c-di-GMP phosphodiesterase class II)
VYLAVSSIIKILNILLYLIPIGLLQYFLYEVYAKKGKLEEIYYLMLYLLPLVLLALSIDYASSTFIIIPDIVRTLNVIFYLGIILYIFVVATKLFAFRKLFKNILQIKKRNVITATVAIILPFIAVYLANIPNKTDFLFYWATSVALIFVSMYAAYFNRRLVKLSALAVTLLYADFTARILSAFPIKTANIFAVLSPVLGLFGVVFVLYEGYLFVMDFPAIHHTSLAHRWHKNAIKIATTIIVVISILIVSETFAFIDSLSQYKSNIELSTKNSLQNTSEDTAKEISNFLNGAAAILKNAAENRVLYVSASERNKVIRNIYKNTKDIYFAAVSVVNDKGIILYTYPYVKSIGKNVSNQPHVKKILTEHIPVVSCPINTVQGFPAIVIHYPLFYNGRFIGSIAGLINLNHFTSIISEQMVNSSLHPFVVLIENKIIVSSTDPELSTFSSTEGLLSPKTRKELFYASNSFTFLDSSFAVETHIPKLIIYQKIHTEEKKRLLTYLLRLSALFFILYLSIWLIRTLDNRLGTAVEEAISKEKKEKEKNKDLSKRLFAISRFLKSISFTTDKEIFYNELLKIAIQAIPNAQKGSIGIKKGKLLYFISSYGYDINLLRKIKLPFDKEKNVVKGYEVKVFEHIDKTDKRYFTKEGIELMKKIGNYGIKSTLIAPLYINKEYIGSIFLDNFESENAFTEEDKKIAAALSNIASVFAEAQQDLNKVKIDLIANLALTNVIEDLHQSEEENIAVPVLKVLKNVVSEDICSFMVSIPKNNETLIFFGGNKKNYVIKVSKPIPLPKTSGIVQPDEISKLKTCEDTKRIFAVPYKNGNVLMYGFSTENIPDETLTVLGKLSRHLYDLLMGVYLRNEINTVYMELLLSLVNSIDLKDRYTKYHSERVTIYSYFIGKELKLSHDKLVTLFYAALLHDIGKIGVPDKVLNKSGKLNNEEFSEIKKHPVIGADMISNVEFLKEASKVLRYHHEHFDGTGYPDGLKGDEIPYLSRIIAVADAFDAMTSTRSYRKAMTIEKAISIIEKESGKQFDAEISKVFVTFVQTHRKIIEETIKNPDAMKIFNEIIKQRKSLI